MRRTACLLGSLVMFAWNVTGSTGGTESDPTAIRPSCIAASKTGEFCLVGDLDHASLMVIHLEQNDSPTQRIPFPRPIIDMQPIGDSKFAAAAADRRMLLLFSCDGSAVRDIQRLPTSLRPRRISVSQDQSWMLVTDRWGRQAQSLSLESGTTSQAKPLDLSFEPQEVVALGGSEFVVADAFGGQLTVIDASKNEVVSSHMIHGHGIRGLAVSKDGGSLLVTHQRLHRIAHTTLDDIHWGNTIESLVSRCAIAEVRDPSGGREVNWSLTRLSDVGHGFADPSAILDLGDSIAVTSGGADQLLMVRGKEILSRWSTGRRPTDLIRIDDGQFAILNSHDASITIATVDADATQSQSGARIEMSTHQLADRAAASTGEAAFYSAKLSHQSWLTCNSCHIDGHTPGLLADTFGDGGFGNAKRIPSLFGIVGTEPFGWLGNKASLRQQIASTLTSTMHGRDVEESRTTALVQFVESLEPPAPHRRATDRGGTRAGRALFESLKCVDCHRPPLFTSNVTRDVGVRDEQDNSRFNPPSLRGLGLRRQLFHDGRYESLEQLIESGEHQQPRALSDRERFDLIFFLQSL